MFDGKMLRGLTGTPMRMIDLANRVFAEAEPEPLTLANLTTKSLIASMGFAMEVGASVPVGRVFAFDDALERGELELAERHRAAAGEELVAHARRLRAHFLGRQVQRAARLRGELDLAGALEAPHEEKRLRHGAPDGEQAVVAEDEDRVLPEARDQPLALAEVHRRPLELVVAHFAV